MQSDWSHDQSEVDLAFKQLKAEHADCVQVIGTMAADPALVESINTYLTRIETINQAIIRLASTRMTH